MADVSNEDSAKATVGSEDTRDVSNIDAVTGEVVATDAGDADSDDRRTILSEEFDLKLREGMLGDFNNRSDKVYSTIKELITGKFITNYSYFPKNWKWTLLQ